MICRKMTKYVNISLTKITCYVTIIIQNDTFWKDVQSTDDREGISEEELTMSKRMEKTWSGMKKNDKKGFTLVELIVVLVIIGILLVILIPSMVRWIDKAKEKEVLVDARSAYLAVQTEVSEEYGANTGKYEDADSDGIIDSNWDAALILAGLADEKEDGSAEDAKGAISGVKLDGQFNVIEMVYTPNGGEKKAQLKDGVWAVVGK